MRAKVSQKGTKNMLKYSMEDIIDLIKLVRQKINVIDEPQKAGVYLIDFRCSSKAGCTWSSSIVKSTHPAIFD